MGTCVLGKTIDKDSARIAQVRLSGVESFSPY
jgi:hypothetical protein